MLRFKCPYCGKSFRARKEHAGRKGKCLGCGKIIRIPQAVAINPKEEPIAAVLVKEERPPVVAPPPRTPPPLSASRSPGIPPVELPGKETSARSVPVAKQILAGVQQFVEKQRKPAVSQRIDEITQYLVSHFSDVTEDEIARAADAILMVQSHSPEYHLLYALRVSKCVPRLKSIKTLASRWSTANTGPRSSSGLQNGRQSSHWGLVNGFLSNLYLQRFHELCEETANKASETAAKRKTSTAKESAYQKATDKIADGAADFGEDLPGLHETKTRWIDYVESLAKQLGGESDEKRLENRQDEMKAAETNKVELICPYCRGSLGRVKQPTRCSSRKCKLCGETIGVDPKQKLFKGPFLTERQVFLAGILEALDRRITTKGSMRDFGRAKKSLGLKGTLNDRDIAKALCVLALENIKLAKKAADKEQAEYVKMLGESAGRPDYSDVEYVTEILAELDDAVAEWD